MPDHIQLFIDRTTTPIGELVIVADSQGNLRAVDWSNFDDRRIRLLERQYGTDGFSLETVNDPNGLTTALRNYFAGQLGAIENLPVKTEGTAFQEKVWQMLREIPCGTTWSYGQLAQRIGQPSAVRAVGLANGANPVGIVVPCHRVIASSGALQGYGGGLDRKRWLLEHESATGSLCSASRSLFATSF